MGLITSRKEKGQGIVELAIILPFLLIILLGIMDFGRVFYAYVTITNASREGARYGSRYPTWIDEGISANPNNVKFHVIQEAANTVTIFPENIAVITDTQTITVTVQVDFQTLFFGNLPYIRDWLSGGAFPIVARSAFPIAPTLYLEVTPPPIPTSTPTHTPTLTPTPPNRYIVLSPDQGIAGSSFEVLGYNFLADDTVEIKWVGTITETLWGPAVLGSTSFTAPATVPNESDGFCYEVRAYWNSEYAPAQFCIPSPTHTPTPTFTPTDTPTPTPTFTPTATPSTRYIIVNPGSGQPASTTTVYGYNFVPDEAVTIEWPALGQSSGPYTVGSTFVLTDTVPSADPGPYFVLARWGPGDQFASDLFIIEELPTPTPTPTFTPTATPTATATPSPTATPTYPYLILSPDSGAFSTPFAIEGHNLMTLTNYSILWDGDLTGITTTTDISGTFAGITHTVPVETPGTYTVKAQDGITATAPFEVIAHGAIAGTTYVSEDGSWPGDPTAGVTVAAYQEGELITETLSVSNPLGYYILEDLPAGTYYVVATYQIYWAAGSVTVTSDTTTVRNFYLF